MPIYPPTYTTAIPIFHCLYLTYLLATYSSSSSPSPTLILTSPTLYHRPAPIAGQSSRLSPPVHPHRDSLSLHCSRPRHIVTSLLLPYYLAQGSLTVFSSRPHITPRYRMTALIIRLSFPQSSPPPAYHRTAPRPAQDKSRSADFEAFCKPSGHPTTNLSTLHHRNSVFIYA